MGISVTCTNGHRFRVKEKYAGLTGKCPKCNGKVKVPELVDPFIAKDSASVLDAHESDKHVGSSLSLVGSRVMNMEPCPKCGAKVPIWHCKCGSCGYRYEHR